MEEQYDRKIFHSVNCRTIQRCLLLLLLVMVLFGGEKFCDKLWTVLALERVEGGKNCCGWKKVKVIRRVIIKL